MKLTRIFIENLMEYDIWGAKSSKQARKGSPWSLPFLIQFSYLSFFAFFSGSAAPIISVWILTIEVTPGTHTIAICCLTEWQHCQVEGANNFFLVFWISNFICKHKPKPSIDIQLYTNTWKTRLTTLFSTSDITDWFRWKDV